MEVYSQSDDNLDQIFLNKVGLLSSCDSDV